MNIKELKEIKKRWSISQHNNFKRIYGCYVNGEKNVIAYINESVGSLTEAEMKKYLALFKKTLSGTLGKNLIDIPFKVEHLLDNPDYQLLKDMRSVHLEDEDQRKTFFDKIIENLDIEENYLILLTEETYDIPRRSVNGENDDSENVFSYFLCSICPVTNKESELGYKSSEKSFRNEDITQIVANPVLGFMFPCFDDRCTNLNNALLYSKDTANIHSEFISGVFGINAPASPLMQAEAFKSAIAESCDADEAFEMSKAICEQLSLQIDMHSESKDPNMLVLNQDEMTKILQDCGYNSQQIQIFNDRYNEDTEATEGSFNPSNIINRNHFTVATPHVKVEIDPSYAGLVKEEMIDGRKCIIIDAEDCIEIKFTR